LDFGVACGFIGSHGLAEGLLDDINDNEPLYSGYLYPPGLVSKMIHECCKQWNAWIENTFEEERHGWKAGHGIINANLPPTSPQDTTLA
jgi:hypothetical protein